MSTDNRVPEDGTQAAAATPASIASDPQPTAESPTETHDENSSADGESQSQTDTSSSASATEDSQQCSAGSVSGSGLGNETDGSSATSPAAPETEATAAVDAPPAAKAPTAAEEAGDRKKVALNPTVKEEENRAVPSLVTETGMPPASTGPVELPGSDDAEIEAEVARALSGDAQKPTTTAAASSDGTMGASAENSVDASIEAAINEAMSAEQVSAPTDSEAATVKDPDDLNPGDQLTGVVQSVGGDSVFLDFGMRLSGVVPVRQFGSTPLPAEGDSIEVLFDQVNEAEGLMQTRLPGGSAVVQSSEWEFLSKGQMVECIVKKTNKGGLEVTVGSLRGFIPASQVDVSFVEDMETFVGKKVTAEITEVKPAKKNLVLSRRKVLNARRAEAKRQLMEELKPDQVRTGVVKTIKDYGAFIDLGGTDGFLPISQMSWIRIGHPTEVISEGQEVEVKVLSIDREKNKISLGMRQLTQNPWKAAESKYEKGATVTGRVTKTEAFGAFVELEPGIEGLVHISELDHRRVKRVTEVLNVGDLAEVQVLEVDPGKKRISLSVKALKAKPEPVEKPRDEDLSPGGGAGYERKRKGPLKGGKGPTKKGGGGLFGNPKDFD